MSLGSSSSLSTLATFARRSASKTLRVATLGLVLGFSVACDDDDNDVTGTNTTPSADITLSKSTVTLVRSSTVPNPTTTVTAELKGTSNTAVTWKSGDTRIATVSNTGVITGVADGSTFVTVSSAADPSINRSVVVNVVSTVVSVSPGSDFLYVGGPTRTIGATVANNTNTAVTWTSSDPAVATVSATGVVTPVGVGTTSIIATSVGDPTKQAASTVRVDAAPHAGFTEIAFGSVVPVSGTTGDRALFWFYAPRGVTNVRVEVKGANGDADLNVMTGAATTAQIFGYSATNRACVSAAGGSNEACNVSGVAPRLYYVMVEAYDTYTGATLTVTKTP